MHLNKGAGVEAPTPCYPSMSSKQHDALTSEKNAPVGSEHASGLETSALQFCPHCGSPVENSLAQHKSRGQCGAYTSNAQEANRGADRDREYEHMPVLEEHTESAAEQIDIEGRRRLADELAAAGVWPEGRP